LKESVVQMEGIYTSNYCVF